MSSSTVERRRDPLRLDGEVVGRRGPRQPGGVLGGEAVQRRLGIELDDAPGRHRAEPLAHVALVEAGSVGQLLARRLAELGERVEEPGAVPDGDHHRQRAAVQQVEHAPGERLGTLRVERRLEHGTSSSREWTLVFHSVLTCARCGQENPEGASFCNACGAPLAEPGGTREERRVVSIVFVDLVGFTARSEKLDPEDVRAILTPYYERVRSELERFGGRVEKFIGDAVMGVFGAPRAFGDDHERAVRAALAVRDWAGEDGLEVRIAVNTGEAIVDLEARIGQGEAMIAGDVVNTAARLQTAAPVGAVLVGEETYLSTRTLIEYQPAFQPVKAKGKAEPVRAWIAIRAGVPAGERPLDAGPDGRPRASARGAHGSLGARRRRSDVPTSSPSSGRPGSASRGCRSSSWSTSEPRTPASSADARRPTARRARTAPSPST